MILSDQHQLRETSSSTRPERGKIQGDMLRRLRFARAKRALSLSRYRTKIGMLEKLPSPPKVNSREPALELEERVVPSYALPAVPIMDIVPAHIRETSSTSLQNFPAPDVSSPPLQKTKSTPAMMLA